ncbi:diacylglycerol kinase [Aromatoleum toluvorans]|nr:diacylglycerol kinase [Aromatoleum toluvorans]
MNDRTVLATKLANSAMEALADHLHPEFHPVIGKLKDMPSAWCWR